MARLAGTRRQRRATAVAEHPGELSKRETQDPRSARVFALVSGEAAVAAAPGAQAPVYQVPVRSTALRVEAPDFAVAARLDIAALR